MKSSLIKHYVENEFKVTDIGTRKRSNHFAFIRYVYFKLCKTLNDESLSQIAKPVNRKHETVMHGIKTFDELAGTELFHDYYESYNKLHKQLSNKTKMQVKMDYGSKLIRLIEKNHRVINNLLILKKSEALIKIAELPKKDLEEFEKLAQGFYKIKSIQNQSP